MSLRQLDYLSSKEGANAFSQIATQVFFELQKPEYKDLEAKTFDKVVNSKVDEGAPLYPSLKDKGVLVDALQQYAYAQYLAMQVTPTVMQTAAGPDFNFTAMLAGILYTAANINIINQYSNANLNITLSKRDFIRLAVMIYENCEVTIRNMKTVNGEFTGKFN